MGHLEDLVAGAHMHKLAVGLGPRLLRALNKDDMTVWLPSWVFRMYNASYEDS